MEILLKNVIQAIPTFAMNVFLLPKELRTEIEGAMNPYWWIAKEGGGWKGW